MVYNINVFFKFLLFSLGIIITGSLQSQEVLSPLTVNPSLIVENNNFKYTYNEKMYFRVDTLRLPFIDDFSTNRLKYYVLEDSARLEGDTVIFNFTVEGSFLDSLAFMYDTTWVYSYDTLNDTILTTPKDPLTVIFYNNILNPLLPYDTIEVWPEYYIYTYDTLGEVYDSAYVIPDSVIYLDYDTVFVVSDDNSMWIDNYSFVNTDYPIEPVTVGVATLDGLDERGYPYDFSDEYSHGIADYLTSKPIDLRALAGDSVYLSFYYQPEGRGNAPESQDSLVLQFFAPHKRKWYSVWSQKGSGVHDFKQVMIPVTDSKFLYNGFQFRFFNYATLSGNLDHWHLDYVYLDSSRTYSDTLVSDVAFTEKAPSFLKDFQYMPWLHFLEDSENEMKDTAWVSIVNQSLDINNTNYYYTISENDLEVYGYKGYSNNLDPQTSYSLFAPLDTFVFSSVNQGDSSEFELMHILNPSGNTDLSSNDTIRLVQRFHNYYAYDDGTAESAYGINVAEGKIAYLFDVRKEDTLQGLQIYFSPVLYDVSDKEFMLTVWELDTVKGVPGEIIYQQIATYTPQYTGFLNSAYYYTFDTTLVVSGKIFVGIEQLDDDMLNVGLDRNNITSKKMYYNVYDTWYLSVIEGAWLIRPMFGNPVTITGVENKKNNKFKITLYPNPVTNSFKVSSKQAIDFFEIYDLLGNVTKNGTFDSSEFNINISEFVPGIYLVKLYVKNTQVPQVFKLIKK